MTPAKYMQGLVLVAVLLGASAVQAESVDEVYQAESFDEVYNGATCTAHPSGSPLAHALSLQHWLFVSHVPAYCHFTMPKPWNVNKLKYVLFEYLASATASVNAKARLCVYSGATIACGPWKTLLPPPAVPVNWVAPPSPIPSYATGAYVHFAFPHGMNKIFSFIPVWSD